jgi:predicted secreted protein with PEFG-CTERM motif
MLLFQQSFASLGSIKEVDTDNNKMLYDQGDEVLIHGVIQDVQPNQNSVGITVTDPHGGKNTYTAEVGADGGQFNTVYSLSNTAFEGIYTVKVSYNGQDSFTFFKAQDDIHDRVTISLDDDSTASYSPGQTVKITGKVDNIDESSVIITITDPSNQNIVDSKSVNLSGNQYSYEYNLKTTASPGRYAVKIIYGANQASTIFEVNGGSNSSSNNDTDGSIDVFLSKSSYKPADTIKITGQVSPVSATDKQIYFVVRDANNAKIIDDHTTVTADGLFTYQFVLNNNASGGQYRLTVSYLDTSKQVTFTVSTGTSSGNSSSSLLIARLDKSSYLAGESMTVTGSVPKILTDNTVNIQVYRPDGTPVLSSSAFVEPSSSTDKSFSAKVILQSNLAAATNYKVKVDYGNDETQITFAISGQSSNVSSSGGSSNNNIMTVKTDQTRYSAGEATVKISGSVASDSIVQGQQVLIRVDNPGGSVYRMDPVDPANDGTYSYTMIVGGKLGIAGSYQVTATYNNKQAKTTFEFGGQNNGRSIYSLKAGSNIYPIEYQINGSGTVKSMTILTSDNKLRIAIDAQDNGGQLTIVLPRQIIDAVKDSKDVPFVVATTDLDAGTEGNVSINESKADNETRTLTIDYKKGTDLIEIAGTSVVPEFGPLSWIVLTVSIIGIILFTARSRRSNNYDNNRSNFFFTR